MSACYVPVSGLVVSSCNIVDWCSMSWGEMFVECNFNLHLLTICTYQVYLP